MRQKQRRERTTHPRWWKRHSIIYTSIVTLWLHQTVDGWPGRPTVPWHCHIKPSADENWQWIQPYVESLCVRHIHQVPLKHDTRYQTALLSHLWCWPDVLWRRWWCCCRTGYCCQCYAPLFVNHNLLFAPSPPSHQLSPSDICLIVSSSQICQRLFMFALVSE